MARKRIKDLDLASSTTGSEFLAIDAQGFSSAKKVALSSIVGSASSYCSWGFTDEGGTFETSFSGVNTYTNLIVGGSIAFAVNTSDFSVSSTGIITYIGTATKPFLVLVGADVFGTTNNDIRFAAVKVNTVLAGGVASCVLPSGSKSESVFLAAATTLSTNNTIRIRVKNVAATNNIHTIAASLSIVSL
ncbi:MAG: hypothetical protein EBR82_57415 [Caulobacteraceae bacterium]|nr:hypothetical protein [Caulobacteraceae bacterium]NDD85772.1 hypothetical protein [bacterium]NDG31283.1 hypothetical protein [bacterium]